MWTYKQVYKNVMLEEYNLITNCIVDTELSNGSVGQCKRTIEGTTIITYLSYTNDMIKVEQKEYLNAYK